MKHDTPILHYIAFLINEHGFVPYKDYLGINLPGVYLFHLLIVKLFGYGDIAFRCVDVFFLLTLLWITYLIMKLLGRRVGFTSVILFGLLYLNFGSSMSLQRDYIAIFPIAVVVLLSASKFISNKILLKTFIIGALFGISASIKPPLVIGLPVVIIYMYFNTPVDEPINSVRFPRHFIKLFLVSFFGLFLVMTIPFLWLWYKGGLPYFWEIFSSYMPLYLQLNNNHEIISGFERYIYLFRFYLGLGGRYILLLPITLGVYIALSEFKRSSPQTRLVLLLITLLFLYSIYPVFAGKFWDYHWMPFIYFGTLCASMILLPASLKSPSLYRRIIPLIVFLFFLLVAVRPANDFIHQIQGDTPAAPKEGNVDKIAYFLKLHLNPWDKVQPLDWTGGAVHGMLLSKSVIATPYIYDFLFYHHISEQYIQRIRKIFIKQLKEEKPRFIIDMIAKPRPIGKDTTREFPELQKFIFENYNIASQDIGFIIWERKSLSDDN